MYKIKTRSGTTYNYVVSWKRWSIDESFLECVWGKEKKTTTLIVPISDILAICQD